jgi:DNA-binding response OmpR family regulator
MLNLVVVEDHDAYREVLVEHLERRGFRTFACCDAEALEDELGGVQADIYLLDLNLPGEDGISLARRLRAAEPDAGIVMLTARSTLEDRLSGYEGGADAYLTKPVALAELDAVLASLSRRVGARSAAPYQLDVGTHTLSGPAGTTALSPGQTRLLAALARAPGRQLETWQVMERLGRSPEAYRPSSLQVAITRLRERLGAVGADREALKAIREIGYVLRIDLDVHGTT